MRRILLTVFLLAGVVVMFAAQLPNADTVLLNGNIYTGDEKISRVEAVAIVDGKIAAVGSTEEIKRWVGRGTKEIDLAGRFVMPGFNDGHVHFANGGRSLLSVNVGGTRSLAEFEQRIRGRLDDFPPGEWVTGRGWDHSLWQENRVPTRADLDSISTKHPMIFTRVDGHSAVANSLALEMAGITGETEAPQGGAIVLDGDGVPTGWLKETAQGLVFRLVPKVTHEQRKQGLLLALEDAARNGITSIHDNSGWEDFLVLQELKEEGKLTLRVTEWLPFGAPLDELKRMRREGGTTDPWLKTGALKGVTDGSGGSLSAAMLEPFANAPGNRGLLRQDPETWKKMAVGRDFESFQIALHAIGDRANRVALDAFEAARKINKRKDARHRIEHSQFVHRDDMPRFKELEVIASAQPCHLLSDLRWAPAILGPEREYEAYAWNTLQKLGVMLAFGTDYPVEPLNPFRGLFAAVAREFEDGSGPEGGWRPEEKISIEEAIRAYTLGSAYAEFEERRKGTLSPGKFADLIVLSQDITAVPASDILKTEVLLTMVGGKVVFTKEKE